MYDLYISGKFWKRVWYLGYIQSLLDTYDDLMVIEVAICGE